MVCGGGGLLCPGAWDAGTKPCLAPGTRVPVALGDPGQDISAGFALL